MSSWIVDAVSSMGYMGIAFLMFLENVFPPIPSEIIMPLAGYLTTQGRLGIVPVIVAGTVGSVAGQYFLYWVARRLGERRVRDWVGRHGRWVAVSPEEVDGAARWLHGKGGWAILVGRLIPGIRSLISIPAGLAGMPLPAFLLYTVSGTTLWTAALAFAGRVLGSQFKDVEQYLSPVSWGVIGLAVVMYLYRVITYKPSDRRPPGRLDTGT
jgi:membrane protein DedA with SNARE-associated domain